MSQHKGKGMLKIFFSYSHKDEEYRDELEIHLALLKRQHIIETWHDRKIQPGIEFSNKIDDSLRSADIILLLISSSFLNSDYCYEIELQQALKQHKTEESIVIPIILRPCDWHDAPFGMLNALPKDGKPISSYSDHDEAYVQIARIIRDTANRINKGKKRNIDTNKITTSLSDLYTSKKKF